MTNHSIRNYPVPVIGFIAYSGTGKTTLLEKLLKLLQKHIRVATIKHAHHSVEIDKPGKDSYRLRKAGASPVLLVSQNQISLIANRKMDTEISIDETLSYLNPEMFDLLVVEGFKSLDYPKIIVHRSDSGNSDDIITQTKSLALVTDLSEQRVRSQFAYQQPVFNINQPEILAEFILNTFVKEKDS